MVQKDLGGFGDARLRRVGAHLLEEMGEQPTTCLHVLAKDCNEALQWRRLTTHAVTTAEQAGQVIAWYRPPLDHRAGVPNAEISRFIDGLVASHAGAAVRAAGHRRADRCGADHVDCHRTERAERGGPIDLAHESALTALNNRLEGRMETLKNPHPQASLAWFA